MCSGFVLFRTPVFISTITHSDPENLTSSKNPNWKNLNLNVRVHIDVSKPDVRNHPITNPKYSETSARVQVRQKRRGGGSNLSGCCRVYSWNSPRCSISPITLDVVPVKHKPVQTPKVYRSGCSTQQEKSHHTLLCSGVVVVGTSLFIALN